MFDIFLTQYGGSFLGPIAKVLGWILNAIYNILGIENVAINIIIFTFIVNLIMLPLTIKQQKFSKMSSKMQPELSKITQKYKGKKDNASIMAQQQETKALYEKYGASPTGGCLPMFITMFVFLALYRVIYAVPAYVDQIYDIYDQVAKLSLDNSDALQYLADNASNLKVVTSGWGDNILNALKGNENYIIDVLTKFGRENWSAFAELFANGQASEVSNIADRIMHINYVFGGLNISETPATKMFPGIIIPIVSVILQYIQTHLLSKNSQMDPDNPMAASMKSMNLFMPIMSGIFCLFFPIGAGIYLIASNLFRIIQQFFVNKYMDNMDIDEMVEKNMEKAKEKREKLGLEVSNGSIKNVATTRTNSVKELDNVNTKKNNMKENKSTNYKKGSIASIAHMMEQSDKGDK